MYLYYLREERRTRRFFHFVCLEDMRKFFRRLTSCVHRPNRCKSLTFPPCEHFFKLSRFELLPDEILIEIFEYLPIVDLYNGFVNLNFRFNLLLRDVHLGIIFDQSIDDNFINAVNYFSKEIVYIHLEYNPWINFKCFSNLRSLIIYLPTTNQIQSINNQLMPKLTRLWIGIINQFDEQILYENLFGKNHLSNIRFCYLFQINFHSNYSSSQISSNLRTLSITNIKSQDFILILALLPNLYQLSIGIDQSIPLTFDSNISHRNLRKIKIEFLENICQLNDFNVLISFVPLIEQCTLFFVNLISRKDYQILQNIILKQLTNLQQLICSIDYSCSISSNRMINKIQKFKNQLPFFQTMKILPCQLHRNQCLRKTFINKTFHQIN